MSALIATYHRSALTGTVMLSLSLWRWHFIHEIRVEWRLSRSQAAAGSFTRQALSSGTAADTAAQCSQSGFQVVS